MGIFFQRGFLRLFFFPFFASCVISPSSFKSFVCARLTCISGRLSVKFVSNTFCVAKHRHSFIITWTGSSYYPLLSLKLALSLFAIMPSVKRPQCGHSFLLIFLGFVIIAYENSVKDPSLIIMILGGISATAGLIWLVMARFLSNRNWWRQESNCNGEVCVL